MTKYGITGQFDDFEQQQLTAQLGMWVFLITEIMFFGGLFTGYTVYRYAYHEAFAEGSKHLYMWIGAFNTAILLCSSTTMAFAVHAAKSEKRWSVLGFLFITFILGSIFLCIKLVEYYLDYREAIIPGIHYVPPSPEAAELNLQLFYFLYFVMTGIHFIHVTIGVMLFITFIILILMKSSIFNMENSIEMLGLYWHFVDIVWIFLFPLLYLIG